MAKNFSGGDAVSQATIKRLWEEFDALPIEAKAVIWDAMKPWHTSDVVAAYRKGGIALLKREVAAWDAWVLRERKPWMDPKALRIGMRREDMPLSPCAAAGVSQLRSHDVFYNPPKPMPRAR